MDSRMSRRSFVVCVFLICCAWAGAGRAEPASFSVPLTGSQCVPPVETNGSGVANLTFDPASRMVTWNISYSGLSSPTTMAHFHGPAASGKNANVVIWLTTQGAAPGNPITGNTTLTPAQAQQFTAGEWYLNVHTTNNPACEIRGQVLPPKG